MDHVIRAYDEQIDLDAAVRTWREVGWIESAEKRSEVAAAMAAANTEVGVLHNEPECFVCWVPGTIRYETTDLSLCAITAVTTSHVGRKLGFASTMTARALTHAVEAGCAVAALGIFEQGFYDKLGFGTADYDHRISFDPATLMVDHVPYRPPVRVGTDDWADMHQAMSNRMMSHGSIVLSPPRMIKAEVGLADNPFALGYRDDQGTLTHFIYGEMKGEHGPWRINALAYRSTDQLLELLRLVRELGDQVRSVAMMEPARVQLQALLANPMREADRSAGSDHETFNRSVAWWQFRILDVEACVAARSWIGRPLRFNLTLTDPAESRLEGAWPGVGGDYTIEIGAKSRATRGHADGLPLMTAGAGAFSRLWFGVRSPSVLAVSDRIEAPPGLMADLDEAMRLPRPVAGWLF